MNELMRKMGPTFVVGAIFTWFCWPYLSGAATNTTLKAGDDAASLPKSLLSPKLKPTNDRDPFRAVDAVVKLLQGGQAGSGRASTEKSDSGAGPAGAAAPASGPPSLVLGGTFIQGDRRMAIINGAVYGLGDALKVRDAETKNGKIKEILPEKVLVQWGSETIEATYPDPSASAAAPGEKQTADPKEPTTAPAEKATNPPGDVPATVSELLRQIQAIQNQ